MAEALDGVGSLHEAGERTVRDPVSTSGGAEQPKSRARGKNWTTDETLKLVQAWRTEALFSPAPSATIKGKRKRKEMTQPTNEQRFLKSLIEQQTNIRLVSSYSSLSSLLVSSPTSKREVNQSRATSSAGDNLRAISGSRTVRSPASCKLPTPSSASAIVDEQDLGLSLLPTEEWPY